jgi:hypothetical protein
MRKVYGEDKVRVSGTSFECGGNSGKRAASRDTVWERVAAYHQYLLGDALEKVGHMGQKSAAMPVEQCSICPHPRAFPAGKHETCQSHGVDTKCVTPLI